MPQHVVEEAAETLPRLFHLDDGKTLRVVVWRRDKTGLDFDKKVEKELRCRSEMECADPADRTIGADQSEIFLRIVVEYVDVAQHRTFLACLEDE